MPLIAAIMLALGATLPAAGQADSDAAQQIINDPNPAHFTVYGLPAPPKSVVDDAVQGGRALPITVTGKGEPFAVGVSVPISKPIRAGDHLVMMFYAKLAKAGSGVTTAPLIGGVQLAAAPYTGLFSEKVDVPAEWKLFTVSGVADKNYPAGAINASFQVNTGAHTMELGLVAVFDKGK
jgi:hypothetical protein